MTKTNGTREIDLNVIECSKCFYDHKTYNWMGCQLPRGKIVTGNVTCIEGKLFTTRIGELFVADCTNCNGTGYIPVCCDNKLELE